MAFFTALTGFGDLAVLLPTAMMTLLWLLLMLTWSRASWWAMRVLPIVAGAGLILGIAASRLLLAIHSTREVGVGLVIGIISLAFFGQGYVRGRQSSPRFVLYSVAAGTLVSHGKTLQAEQLFRANPWYLHVHCT